MTAGHELIEQKKVFTINIQMTLYGLGASWTLTNRVSFIVFGKWLLPGYLRLIDPGAVCV